MAEGKRVDITSVMGEMRSTPESGGKGAPLKRLDAVKTNPYFFLRAWAKALPAADFAALLVRPSLSTSDAALAAAFEVTSRGALLCVSALAAALFTVLLVEVRRALEALRAALGLVPFFIDILLRADICTG